MVNPLYRGNPNPNADLWRGVRAKTGFSFIDAYYRSVDADLRGALRTMSLGIVYRPDYHSGPDASDSTQYLFDCEAGTAGFRLFENTGNSPGSMNARISSNIPTPHIRFRFGDPLDPDDTGFASKFHQNTALFVNTASIHYEEETDYSEDGDLEINGRTHTYTPGSALKWGTNGEAANAFLDVGASGPGGPVQGPLQGTIIGIYMHTEYLSREERMLLRQEIELARDIPEIPKLGGPTLDHIWSMKQLSVPGVDPPTTIVSRGAIGGKSFSINGTASSLEIIDFAADFGSR